MFVRALLGWFTSVFLNAIALLVVAQLFTSFHIENFQTALLASIILSLLNLIVRPILIVFTLPITIVTLGLFIFVINAITLMLTAQFMDDRFIIDGFGIAFIASIIVSIISMFLHRIVKGE